jgi:hypothetical protein
LPRRFAPRNDESGDSGAEDEPLDGVVEIGVAVDSQ